VNHDAFAKLAEAPGGVGGFAAPARGVGGAFLEGAFCREEMAAEVVGLLVGRADFRGKVVAEVDGLDFGLSFGLRFFAGAEIFGGIL
jgi:hypothetical protein